MQSLWGCVHFARALSALAQLERMVLQCLFHSSKCCMKVYDKSGFVWPCFPNLFHHLLGLWLLPTVPLNFLGAAASHWVWVKLSYISKWRLRFWRISISLSQWSIFQHPFPGRNSVSFSTSLVKYCYTSHCFALSPQTYYLNPSSLYNVIIAFTGASGRLKTQKHKTEYNNLFCPSDLLGC